MNKTNKNNKNGNQDYFLSSHDGQVMCFSLNDNRTLFGKIVGADDFTITIRDFNGTLFLLFKNNISYINPKIKKE